MLGKQYALGKREPISRHVYRNLRQAIISGDLPADSRIVEGVLAEQMGVSRTPLREALSKLELDGLVTLSPGIGYTVAKTRHQLEEIFHLRRAIEGYCCRLVAENATDKLVARLEKNYEAHVALGLDQAEKRAQMNAQFHDLIVEACPSARIRERASELREFVFGPSEMEIHTDRSVMQGFLDEHRQLIDAMRARDGEAASSIVIRHIGRALDLVMAARGEKL